MRTVAQSRFDRFVYGLALIAFAAVVIVTLASVVVS